MLIGGQYPLGIHCKVALLVVFDHIVSEDDATTPLELAGVIC